MVSECKEESSARKQIATWDGIEEPGSLWGIECELGIRKLCLKSKAAAGNAHQGEWRLFSSLAGNASDQNKRPRRLHETFDSILEFRNHASALVVSVAHFEKCS
jgi:hypothetical protein